MRSKFLIFHDSQLPVKHNFKSKFRRKGIVLFWCRLTRFCLGRISGNFYQSAIKRSPSILSMWYKQFLSCGKKSLNRFLFDPFKVLEIFFNFLSFKLQQCEEKMYTYNILKWVSSPWEIKLIDNKKFNWFSRVFEI